MGFTSKLAALAGALAALSILAACGLHGTGAGTCGTEVPDDQEIAFYGCAERPGGGPAVSARVFAVGRDMDSNAYAESGMKVRDYGTTGPDGRFEFGKRLAEGSYDLFFEETASVDSGNERPVQRLIVYRNPTRPASTGRVRLEPPGMLAIRVEKGSTGDALLDATCDIHNSPYPTGKVGLAEVVQFWLPAGTYQVSCTAPYWNTDVKTVQVEAGSGTQAVLNLRQDAEDPNPLPAPQNLAVAYDTNSGMATLTWSPVTDKRLVNYGIRRTDVNQAGAPIFLSVTDTAYTDPAFSPRDSAQSKTLVYTVYSQREAALYPAASRSVPIKLSFQRPRVYGPRVGEIRLLPKPDGDSSYRAGDTVRIEASWTNAMRENSLLYWRVAGVEARLGERSEPAASGTDTLAFPLPTAGGYDIGFMIEDAGNYRSWSSKVFQFYGTRP